MAMANPKPHTILVTGATDGIGLILAKNYAVKGHNILATGRRTIADDQHFFGVPNITYINADQEYPKPAAQAIAAAMRDLGWDQLDLAILNGATGWSGDPALESASEITRQIDVNLTAPITITQALAPWLFVDGGKLVLVGSTAAIKGHSAFATYSATKAGLDGFARSLAQEWTGRAEVQIVHPGPIRTGMHGKAGLKTGVSRVLFMSPERAAKAIQMAIRKGHNRRIISRSFGWRSMHFRTREGRL